MDDRSFEAHLDQISIGSLLVSFAIRSDCAGDQFRCFFLGYHHHYQQTKNLLVSYNPNAMGFF